MTARPPNTLLRSAAALALAAAAAAPNALRAQARQVGGLGITVWSDGGFRGRNATFRQDVPDLGRYGLARAISSFRAAGGQYWEGCEQTAYRGRCQIFSGEERDLAPAGWNDVIVSLRRVRGGGGGGPRPPVPPPEPPPPSAGGVITLYSGPRYSGTARRYADNVPDLARAGFNDRAASARAEGPWVLCAGAGYSGCRQVRGAVPDLGAVGLRYAVSSLRPVRGGALVPPGPGAAILPVDPARPRQLRLYVGTGYRGGVRTVNQATPNTGVAGVIGMRSLDADGSWLVCDRPDYAGTCRVATGRVADVRSLGLAVVRSARPD